MRLVRRALFGAFYGLAWTALFLVTAISLLVEIAFSFSILVLVAYVFSVLW